MKHSEKFRQFLVERNAPFEDLTLQSGGVGFRFVQSLENGPRIIIGVSFDQDDAIVDIRIFNIAKIDNPLKREPLLELINELNTAYRYTKFLVEEGEVCAGYSLVVEYDEDYSASIFDTLIMLLESVENELPKFMKIQWT